MKVIKHFNHSNELNGTTPYISGTCNKVKSEYIKEGVAKQYRN
jgi:hypothetical protein